MLILDSFNNDNNMVSVLFDGLSSLIEMAYCAIIKRQMIGLVAAVKNETNEKDECEYLIFLHKLFNV